MSLHFQLEDTHYFVVAPESHLRGEKCSIDCFPFSSSVIKMQELEGPIRCNFRVLKNHNSCFALAHKSHHMLVTLIIYEHVLVS